MRLRVVLFLLITAVLAADARAQSKIEGVVRDKAGNPVAGVTVQLDGPPYKKPLTTTTNEDGSFAFEGIRAGTRVRLQAIRDLKPFAQGFTVVSLWVEHVDVEEHAPATTPSSTSDVLARDDAAGSVIGIVRTKDGLPIPDARVKIDRTSWSTGVDDVGRYGFSGLRSGMRLRLLAYAPGYEDGVLDVAIATNQRLTADFALDRVGAAAASETETVIDVAAAAAPAVASDAAGAEGTATPATRGVARIEGQSGQLASAPAAWPDDVFRSVQFVPYVTASALERVEDLPIRGGTADQTLVTFDGITLYQLPHTQAMFSPLNPGAVGHAAFSPDPFRVGGTGRLSGALKLTGPDAVGGRPTGRIDVGYFGAGGTITAPLGKRASFSVSARRSPPSSVYDDVLDLFADGGVISAPERTPRYSGGTFSSVPKSYFYDVNGRVTADPTSQDRLTFSFYDARDDRRRPYDLGAPLPVLTIVPDDVFDVPNDAVVHASELTTWKARGIGGAWARQWSRRAATDVSFARSEYTGGAERAWLLTSPSTNADYSFDAGRGGSSGVRESNTVTDTTLRADATVTAGFAHALRFGGEIATIDIGYGLDMEGLVGRGRASAFRNVLTRADSGRVVAVYAEDAWRPMTRLTIVPGVRAGRFSQSETGFLDPRVSASYQITRVATLKAGWSIDHQALNRLTREDRMHGDSEFWALADGTSVLVPRVQQVAGGAEVELPGAILDVQAYYRRFDDLTMFAPRQFAGAFPTNVASLFHHGTGKAVGIEGLVRYDVPKNSFRAAINVGRIEYTYPTLEASPFVGSQDQLAEMKATDTMRFGGWSVGTAMVIGSGRPYTPASAIGPVWYPSGASVYDVTFSAKNSVRLVPYHRLDVSGEREFRLNRLVSRVGATVFNVYDRKNVAHMDYETASDTILANEVLLMGRVVTVYFSVGF